MEESLNRSFSRHYLESLSTGELVELADRTGIDIPPGLERIFIIKEFLENSIEEKQETEEEIMTSPDHMESAALPKQYNISYIEAMIRDPFWVFVFWEIKKHDREMHESADDFKGYCLRVIPLNKGETTSKQKEDAFSVLIGAEDSERYLGFAEHSLQANGCYIIKLCVIRGNSELQLAVSLPFTLPGFSENDNFGDIDQKPLIRLSGARDFSTIKSKDRQSRNKRQ
ncbi:MAG: DUF4912 domain-containing protein [Treponema sp.]|jgi:hypothetical protein|nr:DUF4912 domain-containing protein [Treponema sp.]